MAWFVKHVTRCRKCQPFFCVCMVTDDIAFNVYIVAVSLIIGCFVSQELPVYITSCGLIKKASVGVSRLFSHEALHK